MKHSLCLIGFPINDASSLDKKLNSLIYRTLFYVNIYGSYKLLKTVRFLAHSVYCSYFVQRVDVKENKTVLNSEKAFRALGICIHDNH